MAVVFLATASVARAQLAAQVEPSYVSSANSETDASGRTTYSGADLFQQRYRLTFDRNLYPFLGVSAGGLFDLVNGTRNDQGIGRSFERRNWSGYGRVGLGGPVLSGGAGYDRREGFEESVTEVGRFSSVTPVRESYSAFASWRPADLPSLDLRFDRAASFDKDHVVQDRVTDTVALTSRYKPSQPWDFSYASVYNRSTDKIQGVTSDDLLNSLSVSWGESFLDKRISSYASYNVATRSLSASTGRGAVGNVELLRSPIAGLSAYEGGTSSPARIVLSPTPALVDGGVTASAGINIGWGPIAQGDIARRHIGAAFAGDQSTVDLIYVWVNKPIPDTVALAYSWAAYQSSDNFNWTEIPIVAAVQFNPFQNRFEIAIRQTGARYLKVITNVLPLSATSEQGLAEVFVTEIQFLRVGPASELIGQEIAINGNFTGSTKVILARKFGLTYDVSVFATHANQPSRATWALVNGVSAMERLTPSVTASARVDRSDSDVGPGHESANRWSVALGLDILPTLSGLVAYSGDLSQTVQGTSNTNSVSASARADLYRGISTSGNVGFAISNSAIGQEAKTANAAGSVRLDPLRNLTLNGGGSISKLSTSGGGLEPTSDTTTTLDATATYSPYRALALSGGVSRYTSDRWPPTTLARFSLGFTPFPRGDLQLRYSYQETLETRTDERVRTQGPSLRWNIRPGWHADAAYNTFVRDTPTTRSETETLFATLVIIFR